MTNNQLKYAQLQEDKRHNAEVERMQEYSNYSDRLKAHASQVNASAAASQAATAYARQAEDLRHNVANEKLTRRNQNLQVVHNIATGISARRGQNMDFISDVLGHDAQYAKAGGSVIANLAKTFVS